MVRSLSDAGTMELLSVFERAVIHGAKSYLQKKSAVISRVVRDNSNQSTIKCIGIMLEIRLVYCLKPPLSEMLNYGCTWIEIGVQSIPMLVCPRKQIEGIPSALGQTRSMWRRKMEQVKDAYASVLLQNRLWLF